MKNLMRRGSALHSFGHKLQYILPDDVHIFDGDFVLFPTKNYAWANYSQSEPMRPKVFNIPTWIIELKIKPY